MKPFTRPSTLRPSALRPPVIRLLFALLIAGLPAAGPPARADDGRHPDHDRVRRAVEEGRILPLSAILARAATDPAGGRPGEMPGELLEAELEESRGGLVYELTLLTADGRVIKRLYDARSGRPLPPRDDDQDKRGPDKRGEDKR